MSIITAVSYSPDDELLASFDTLLLLRVSSRSLRGEAADLSLKADCFFENVAKEKVFMQFVDSSRVVIFLSGRIYIVGIGIPLVRTSLSLLGTVSPPPGSTCVEVGHLGLLVGTLSGALYVTKLSGQVLCCFPLLGDEITCLKRLRDVDRVLIGTKSGFLMLFDLNKKQVVSKLKVSSGSISYISLDARCNWFCAIVQSGKNSALLLSGSTRSLSQFFESKPVSAAISRTVFANVGGGLSILASNPSPNVILFPIDLSSSTPRLQLSKLDAVFDMQLSHSGESIICAGLGGIQILSANNLETQY